MMKLQRPAPYFANALLAAVDVLYFSKYLTLRLRIRTSKLIIDKRILFNVRWQGRRYDFKICVQAKTVAKRKAPKQKLSELKTVVAPKTLERKTNVRWPKRYFQSATAIAVQRSAFATVRGICCWSSPVQMLIKK